jgi:hypothetical protein
MSRSYRIAGTPATSAKYDLFTEVDWRGGNCYKPIARRRHLEYQTNLERQTREAEMYVDAFKFSPVACVVAVTCLSLVPVPANALDPGQVSKTSIMVACHRAITARDPDPETRNPDYLAEKLLDAELMALVPACVDLKRPFEEVMAEYTQRRARSYFAVVARTKHIDQSLQASLAGGVRQVVILGAGLDSRAYRMGPDHKDVRFFEVDSRYSRRQEATCHALAWVAAWECCLCAG